MDEKDVERLSNSDKTRTGGANVGGVQYSLAKREEEKTTEEKHEVRVDVDKIKTIKPTTRRKETTGSKILKALFNEDIDTFAKAREYVFYKLMIPALKETIWSMLGVGLGISEGRRKKRRDRDRRDYASMYPEDDDDRRDRRSRMVSVPDRDFSDILFASESEALTALSILNDVASEYDYVRVSDLYDLAGISSGDAEDRWGWYPGDFNRCTVKSCRDYDEDDRRYVMKYYIRGLPEPVRLRRG